MTSRTATTLALGDDPVRTARSKGITDRVVLRRHALPFAYASASAYAGASMNIMILNAAIVERLFNLPGSFRLAQDPNESDRPILQRFREQLVIAAEAIDSGAGARKLADWVGAAPAA